jgi:hypothetical protein
VDYIVVEHPVEAVAGNSLVKSIKEDRFIGCAVAYKGEQRCCGGWPERTTTCLVALAP